MAELIELDVIEGTGAELAEQLRQPERADRRFRVIAVQEEATQEAPSAAPNEKGLAIMRAITERQKGRRYTDPADTPRLLKEARGGAMYGCEPTE